MASLRFRLRQKYWAWTAPRKIAEYVAHSGDARLQIGTGSNLLDGWLNTTLYPLQPGTVFLDACLPFPMPTESFRTVFSEHVIEHLEFDEGANLLGESFRILKRGGRIRIATPDLAQIVALYAHPDGEAQQRYNRWIMDTFRPQVGEYNPAHVVNQSFHGWRHKFIYDEATLVPAFEQAGFTNIRRVEPGMSEDETLCGIEQHGQTVGSDEAMRYETMVFEAEKA